MREGPELQRIRKLAIPPAYEDVWICPDPRGHLQATGRDARGRKQYRYHPEWRLARDADKFERMLEFGATLPRIRRRVTAELARPVDARPARETVLATLVRLLDTTLVRVGNDEYARTNNSFGLTTLRNRHAAVSGSTLKLRFRGKSGVVHEVALEQELDAAPLKAGNAVTLLEDGPATYDAMFAAITDRTRLVWLTTPNNPTGQIIPKDVIVSIAEAAPRALVFVDEAYAEFASGASATTLLATYPVLLAVLAAMADGHDVRTVEGLAAPVSPADAGAVALGDVLLLVPGHCDPTVNLHDTMVGVTGGGAVGSGQHRSQAGQLCQICVELTEQGVAVGQADVAPHFGRRGGNPGEVAKSAGGILEQQVGMRLAGDVVDQRKGQQVRQVADRGEARAVATARAVVNGYADFGVLPVENLIAVGAMDCFGRPRREMLWEVGVRGQETGVRSQRGGGRSPGRV